METSKKRIKLGKLEDEKELMKKFGWIFISADDMRPDNTVLLVMERDPNARRLGKLRDLERQYRIVNRKLPLGAIINGGLGLLFLIIYSISAAFNPYAFLFIYAFLTFFGIAIFLVLVFLISLFKRRKINEYIFEQANKCLGVE